MKKTTLWRSVVALATACICLVATTTPAGAAAVAWTVGITMGTGTLSKTGATTLTLPFHTTAGAGCSQDADVSIDVPSGGLGTFDITGFAYTGRMQPFGFGTSYFIMEVTRTGSASGSGNDANNAISGVGLSLRIRIWAAADQYDGATSCSVTGTPFANWTTTLTLDGTYVLGTPSNPGLLDTVSLDSIASTVLIGTSSPPFSIYSIGRFSVTGLGLKLLTSP